MVLSHVPLRNKIISCFLDVISTKKIQYDYICGIATAGIPHASFIADRLQEKMIYVRTSAKGHGKKNQIEGDYLSGKEVLLVEDLINQGSSSSDAILILRESSLNVNHCLSIVDYEMEEAKKRFDQLKITLHSLTKFSVLVDCAFELKLIDNLGKTELQNWHRDPKNWTAK
jgi:orotate phosphoribosyltransferase